MTLPDLEWHRFGTLPISTSLCHSSSSDSSALTMNEVRQRYVSEVADLSFVVWRSSTAALLGFKSGIDELVWNTNQPFAFELRYCRPGKGKGNISLSLSEQPTGSAQLVLLSDHFNQESLDWFRLIGATLSKMLPNNVTEHDDGYDA